MTARIYEVRMSQELVEELFRDGAEHRSVKVDNGIPHGAELFEARFGAQYPGYPPELLLRFRDQFVPPEVVKIAPRVTYTAESEG